MDSQSGFCRLSRDGVATSTFPPSNCQLASLLSAAASLSPQAPVLLDQITTPRRLMSGITPPRESRQHQGHPANQHGPKSQTSPCLFVGFSGAFHDFKCLLHLCPAIPNLIDHSFIDFSLLGNPRNSLSFSPCSHQVSSSQISGGHSEDAGTRDGFFPRFLGVRARAGGGNRQERLRLIPL